MIFGKRVTDDKNTQGSVLLLQVPRTNEKKELAAEQLFASLHGLLQSSDSPSKEKVSFEIAVKSKRIGFYVWVPRHLKSFVEDQIYAQYPSVQISEVDDYAQISDGAATQLVAELRLTANEALPIKTFPSFEVDPLAAITAALAQFEDNEEAWIQLIITPAPDNWYKRSERYAALLRHQTPNRSLVGAILATDANKPAAPKIAEHESTQASAAEDKSHKLAYTVTVRIVYSGSTGVEQGKMRLQAITASFKQFNTTYLNGFTQRYLGNGSHLVAQYTRRLRSHNGFVCNIEEIASLYHLPHTNVETPNILWASAKTAEPPANLPMLSDTMSKQDRLKLSPIAVTNFRGNRAVFGMPRSDRGRHLYILGQTGVGKSGLLELLTISDIYSPYGFAVIDPHGDYALNTLRRIPEDRVGDVVYFNPADTDYPIAFNPMEVYDPKLKTHTCSELIGVLKRIFESWGPRLEYILRYSILALLDYPDSTMLDITRILTEQSFRDDVIAHIEDPVVRNFWTVEFASWGSRFATEAVAPVLNKVGAFTANPIVRNIIGQPKSSFNIREIMDERKILIVNLSRGLIGEDNASLLGALLVTKMQMAAMSRADIDNVDKRVPFYLYVDEFQNFATDSFTTILSEARKYGLILTVANQYIAQMSQGVKDAVFGNVGSIIAFRMSADDSRTMVRYFEPHFSDYDLVHMHNRHFAINMTISGEKVQSFSATSLNLPEIESNFVADIIHNSRSRFAYTKAEIEVAMNKRYKYEKGGVDSRATPVIEAIEQDKKVKPAVIKPKVISDKPKKKIDAKDKAWDFILGTSLTRADQAETSDQVTTHKKTRRSRRRPAKKEAEPIVTKPVNKQDTQELSEDNIISLR